MFRFFSALPVFVTPPFSPFCRGSGAGWPSTARVADETVHTKKEKPKRNKMDKPFVVLRARSSRCGHLAGDPPSLFLIAERAPTVAVVQTHTKYGTEPTNHLLALQSRSGPYCPPIRWSCTGSIVAVVPPPYPSFGVFAVCFVRSRLLTPLPDSTKKQNKKKYKPETQNGATRDRSRCSPRHTIAVPTRAWSRDHTAASNTRSSLPLFLLHRSKITNDIHGKP
jgi:hypothetical protein